MKRTLLTSCWLMMMLLSVACSSAYYGTLEKFGVHKRDIMVDRIESARDSQTEAKEQFNSALEEFTEVVDYDGGDLQSVYDQLNDEYQSSLQSAETVRDRIKSVESVSEDLFDEWEDELDTYKNQSLRKDSEQKLKETRREYAQLIQAMHNAESKMQPVLDVFGDQVLYLKHNLNARAINSIKNEYVNMESNVNRLVNEMEKSIREANAFIATLKQ